MDFEVNELNSRVDFSLENENLMVNASSPSLHGVLKITILQIVVFFLSIFCNFYCQILYLVFKLWNKKLFVLDNN